MQVRGLFDSNRFMSLVALRLCWTRKADGSIHLQLMVPAESAHDTIAGLGEVGLLQFKDLSADKSAFQRTYASQVS